MIPTLLAPLVAAIAHSVDPSAEPDPLVPTQNPVHGDYQWNFCFRVAKERKQNPRALAESVVGQFVHPAIVRAEVAGPGFINLFLDDRWLEDAVRAQVASPAMGVPQAGAGKTVVVDFSSPNVAKRMHIGHMRSTHIGHALYRLHLAAGWTVVGDNHIGDWGTPFGKLIVAWERWRDEAAYAADPVGELERLYVQFGNESKADPELGVVLGDLARARTVALQSGDPEITGLWKRFLADSLAEFETVYRRMGVRFDVVLGESTYQPLLDGVVQDLLASGSAELSDGAVITRFPEADLKDHVAVIRKGDGAATYATTDLACMRYRIDRWHPDRIVIVTDMRQQLHFRQLFAVARRWGIAIELQHAWFGMLVLPEGAMSTRQGNVIRLVDLLDEAVARARAVVDSKSPDLPEADRAAIAEAIGVGAIRYADLSQHPQTNVTFQWDRMLALDGNTAPYLLYSHARCASLLAKAGEPPDLNALRVGHPAERALLLALARYPEAVSGALSSYRPNLLCDHLYEVATRFNRFYHELSVLTGGDDRAARLALVEASRRVLRHGATVLGLTVLDRM